MYCFFHSQRRREAIYSYARVHEMIAAPFHGNSPLQEHSLRSKD
jgi:hypothetical protein